MFLKTLIAGRGEVGAALGEVLRDYKPKFVDIDPDKCSQIEQGETFDILHISFPYTQGFFEDGVKTLVDKFSPKQIVIHSTVPVGVSRKLGALHSPIRGLHPNLSMGIYTFVKYIGGEGASSVADYFRRAGIRVCLFDTQEATEALKLWDTQYYLECVRFAKRVKKYCEKHGLNFTEIYKVANESYNLGYSQLGHPEYVRPVLEPIMTEVGGHCLTPNEKLLQLSE